MIIGLAGFHKMLRTIKFYNQFSFSTIKIRNISSLPVSSPYEDVEHDFSPWAFHRYTLTNKFPFSPYVPSIHKQIITQSFSNIPLCSNIQHSTFPHQPKAGGPPFLSRTGNLLAPAPINSNSFFEIAFFPRCLYLHQKMYIYYFMLYLAESLTGRNYTEGKLLRYFPLWRERGTIRPQADGGK